MEKNRVHEWLPVPSLGYKYEVFKNGSLRNAKTKQILKKISPTSYAVTINRKRIFVTISNLLWEVHGILPKRSLTRNIPVTIQKDKVILHFKNIQTATEYLSKSEFYTTKYIRYFFSKRKTEIFGWQITYHLPKDF